MIVRGSEGSDDVGDVDHPGNVGGLYDNLVDENYA